MSKQRYMMTCFLFEFWITVKALKNHSSISMGSHSLEFIKIFIEIYESIIFEFFGGEMQTIPV